MRTARWLWGVSFFASVFAAGCSSEFGDSFEPVDSVNQALNVCNETVPAKRFIDGFPAYAQCDSHEKSAIWSNNGIDTSDKSLGSDWFRTQYSGGYQCTELARRYLHFRWKVDYQHGNAGEWCDGKLPSTLTISTTPVHGDLIVFEGGVCGASPSTGHIAVVDEVDTAGGKVTIVEQNQANRRTTKQSCAKCFLHVVANDGSVGAGGSSSSGAGGTNGSSGGRSNSGGAPSNPGTGGAPNNPGTGGAPSANGGSASTPSGSAGTATTSGGTSNTSQPGSSGSGGSTNSGVAGADAAGAAGGTKNSDTSRRRDPDSSEESASCSVSPRLQGNSASPFGIALLGFALTSVFARRRRSLP